MPSPTPLEDYEFDLSGFLVLRSALDTDENIATIRHGGGHHPVHSGGYESPVRTKYAYGDPGQPQVQPSPSPRR